MLSGYRNSQVFLTEIRINLGTLSAVGPPDARIHLASGGTTQSQAHFEKFTLASPEVIKKQMLGCRTGAMETAGDVAGEVVREKQN